MHKYGFIVRDRDADLIRVSVPDHVFRPVGGKEEEHGVWRGRSKEGDVAVALDWAGERGWLLVSVEVSPADPGRSVYWLRHAPMSAGA